jgi:hypothetical protein
LVKFRSSTTRVLREPADRETFVRFLEGYKLPCTVTVTKGAKRSVEQNRLQRLWMNEVSEQLGDQTPEEIRAYCKLTIGVPILRAENEEFREAYDRLIRDRLTYEEKLQAMAEPLDFPVTRIMTTHQKARYLDEVYRHWAGKGVVLTDPDPFESTARLTAPAGV